MQVFTDDGTCVDVRVDGANGVPIVLIAGFPLTREIWNAQSESLSHAHRAIRPELRGVGKSSVPDGPYLMEVLASDVATALDALGIERAAIAGHSLGGYVALAFARMYSERLTHLALVCSRLAADSPERAAQRAALADRLDADGTIDAAVAAFVPALAAERTARERPGVTERLREIAGTIDPKGAAALLRGMAMRPDAGDIAADLDVPVAVIAGAADVNLSLDEARGIAAAFPRGRLVVCEHSGHVPMLEEPQRVSDALAALLTE
ncbi:MAG TPA: alpha/beta hydrolase [Candidatus Tumulicola sp.]|nr:alpha/beta hydrolase [Candidatus Tumulicola sp.]